MIPERGHRFSDEIMCKPRNKPQTTGCDKGLWLLSAQAVRARAQAMLDLGLNDRLAHFRVDLTALDSVADLVIATMQEAYPALDVPLHARWRHFVRGGVDRWAATSRAASWKDAAAQARSEFD